MRCDSCGSTNPEGMKFCGNCGKPLQMAPQPPPPVTTEMKARNCVACGRAIPWDAGICMYCGHDYRVRASTKPGTEGDLMTGGILTLLASILGIALLLFMYTSSGWDVFTTNPIFVLSFACCVVGLAGGFAALASRFYPLAVLGSAASIFSPAFFFGIPGLILVAKSATKFKDFTPR